MDRYIKEMCKEFLFGYYMAKPDDFYSLYNSHIKEHSEYLLNEFSLRNHWMSNYNVSYIKLCCEAIVHRWHNMDEEKAKEEILQELKNFGGEELYGIIENTETKEKMSAKERGKFLVSLARIKRRCFLMLLMYYYCVYGDVWNGMLFTPNMKPLQLETTYEMVEYHYGFQEFFSENRFVKRGVQKLRKMLFEKMASSNGLKEYSWERLGEAILTAFATTNGFDDSIPGVNTGHCGVSLQDSYLHIYYMLPQIKCYIGVGHSSYSHMEDMKEDCEKTIDELLRAYILSHMAQEILFVRDRDAEGDIEKYTKDNEELKPNYVNRVVVNANLDALSTSCIWGLAIHMLHKSFSIYQEKEVGYQARRIMTENDFIEKEKDEMQELNEKLQKENDDLKKEVDALKEKIKKMSNQEKQRAATAKPKKELKDKKDETIRELERNIRRKDLELERSQNALEEAKNINIGLTQKIERLKEKRNEKIPEADKNKRYLFVCEHEGTSKRIIEAFPNSIIASNYDITPANAGCIDAVICITKEISHGEYARVKNQCIQYDMPFINCNVINVERISQSIAAVMGSE